MRHTNGSLAYPGAQTYKGSKKQRIFRIAVVDGLFCLGMMTSSAALGSHLTMPGSQDLDQPPQVGHQSLARQLEAINKYTSPHAASNGDEEAVPVVEQSSPSLNFLPSGMATKPTAEPPHPLHSATTEHAIPSTAEVHKNTAQDHTEMGWMFLLSGRLPAAMAAYREALRQHPRSAHAYIGMGITLKSLGKTKPAEQAIQQALKLNPRLSSALVHLGYLYADGRGGHSDLESARRLFDHAFQLGDPFAGIALLDLQSRSGSQR
jgi:tetratricopeptide (TPR) repeat protein